MRLRLAGLVAVLAGLVGGPALAAGTPVQQTWHADQANVPNAREAGRAGADVVVAVLDSWVDGAHPDFEGRVLPGADCLQAICRPGPASRDQCNHGTHVAGTVASSSFGVATRARILPVRVLAYDPSSGECVGQADDVTAGIRWAVGNGAHILNLSLGPDVPGLSASSSITTAVQEAASAGVVVVFSAGNASIPVADSYGGSALIVAATGPSGELALYSQRGAGVDLAAPGGDPRTTDVCTQEDCVTSLFPDGRYAVAAGTSMAAPHVSGVAALLLGQDPTRTREQVLDRLLSTARPLVNAGHGLIDAQAALGATTSPSARTQTSTAPAPVVISPSTAPPRRPAAPTSAAPAPVATTAALPSPSPSSPPPVAAPAPRTPSPAQLAAPPIESSDPVPVWTAVLAGALIASSGLGTMLAARPRR